MVIQELSIKVCKTWWKSEKTDAKPDIIRLSKAKENKAMNKKEIIIEMVRNGYNLMGRPIEWYEANFDEVTLQSFLDRFLASEAKR